MVALALRPNVEAPHLSKGSVKRGHHFGTRLLVRWIYSKERIQPPSTAIELPVM